MANKKQLSSEETKSKSKAKAKSKNKREHAASISGKSSRVKYFSAL
jgi:hypothetical protein